ncbi:chloramphenicol-sensitive protein RarD [Williamwhitmania taraxaci]|uniref:Chloramphenicol-sensitive protein RarD n=1 Tax=Williamwhitmania taraxaci TaxID=1640674 RepID=A0A1G6H3D7_9BACT|nr:chloramphenicol-sensitive protein RarD [Williamwhitmania taraxaci]
MFYAIAAYGIWGILPIYWKSIKQIPATDILAHRIFWSFLFLAVIISGMRKWGEFKLAFKSLRSFLAVGLASILISTNWLLYIWAVNNNHIVEASLGYFINPLLTILLGRLVFRERSDVWQNVAIGLTLISVAFLTYQYGRVPWIALTLATSFAIYGLVKKLSTLTPLTGLGAETMLVAPLALGFLLVQFSRADSVYSPITLTTVILIVLTGVVTSVPLLLFAQSAKRVPLSTLGFIQYLSPSLSLILGIFLYHERFTHIDMLSFGCIWVALAIYSLSRKDVLGRFRRG